MCHASRRKWLYLRSRASGFTLIEIVVAMAVMALLFGVVVSQTDVLQERDMKQTTNKLASTIRYLYNKAAMEKLYIRLVLDLEERSYWVEATSDPLTIAREDTTSRGSKKDDEKKKEKEKEKEKAEAEKKKAGEAEGKEEGAQGSDEGAEGEGAGKIKVPEPTFGQVDSYLLKPTKLPDTVFFKDVQVEHRRGPVEGGQESIYFFPNGYVERAIINLRDEDDEVHYSLKTQPLSGKVDIENAYRTMGEK